MDGIHPEVRRVSTGLRHHEPLEPGDPRPLYGHDQYGGGTTGGGQPAPAQGTRAKSCWGRSRPAPVVKIVAGNKCDLKDGRAVSARDGLAYARKHGCGFMETSAREMVNIEETFACGFAGLFPR